MKRFFAMVLVFMCLTAAAQTQPQKVKVLWPFIVSSTQALYTKQILIEANNLQNKYEFLFEPALGAGGLISVQRTLAENGNGQLTLLAHTGAFFVRPALYPKDQYLNSFKPIMLIANSNAALVTRGGSLQDLIRKKKISFATAGAGSLTHLYAEVFVRELKQQGHDIEPVMVHFKSAPEAFMAVTGGHVDATFDFTGNVQRQAVPGQTTVIGVTGRESTLGPTLISLGFTDTGRLQNKFAFYATTNVSDAVVDELQELFLRAEKSESVQKLYVLDHASTEQRYARPGKLDEWYRQTQNEYVKAAQGVKAE
jgi:tripartite-type tricarboxylate transporter receptor subunit TctC